ncbi:DUF1361 domain-containing protein [Rasiella rasia]|uniref:DUF1361 domain-containing protein n=1 Tax=Rasiella rasia TaxID=2744027 RepID=A0A6G6GN26_9FLAO|nr:DUF1361 domain-containing protein [Rasiella rasia]QIE59101.1 DUF1361 domain-containing protein [Rasiella rasia]
MEKIKNFINTHFYTLFPLIAITVVSLFALMIRLKITHSFFFLFLVWNLFLAVIPFVLSFILLQYRNASKIAVSIVFIVWLLFLPNAPYILTDLIHLQHSKATLLGFDALLIGLFAIGGMLCYLQSMFQMEAIATRFLARKYRKWMLLAIPFLTGFGIYLGRFLRFNSWDILQDPISLVVEVTQIIIKPSQHMGAWIVTIGFGCFLWVGYVFYKKISLRKNVLRSH